MRQSENRNRSSGAPPSRETKLLVQVPIRRRFQNAPPDGESPFFTVAQLAIRWGISERQVRRDVASGELTPTRFGRSLRFSAAEVARFEASRTEVK